MNYGDSMAEVERWMRESVSEDFLLDAVNDAVESLWESVALFSISNLLNGPTATQIVTGSERTTLVSVADPIVAPTGGQVVAIVGSPVAARGATNVYVAYTLVTESGSETLPSPTLLIAALAGNVAQMNSPAYVPGAVGYNVYMAIGDPARLIKQSDEPVDFQVAAFMEPDTGANAAPDGILPPSVNSTGDNIHRIVRLEMQMPDATYRTWDAASMDSTLWQRAAGILASSSPYQNYAWDLINQTVLEVRPAAGSNLTPRYWYVVKPRRSKFKGAKLPFTTVSGAAYIRYQAISLIKLSLEEYEASKLWEAKADKEERKVVAMYLNAERANKRVVPFMYGRG